MNKAKDFYSKSVADAIRQACADFGTSQEKLDIEVVQTGSAGIFGLCRKRAHIRVHLKEAAEPVEKETGKEKSTSSVKDHGAAKDSVAKADKAEDSVQQAKSSGKSRGKSSGKQNGRKVEGARSSQAQMDVKPMEPPADAVIDSVKSDLGRILGLMGFPSDVSATFENTSIRCQIDGEHEDEIVGSDGRTLDSLQYLLRKISSRELPDRMMIDLNAGDFRQRREDELKKTAVELAEKVKTDGKTQAIPALNPSERRVVHVTLQEDKSIRSRSVGDGLFKKVLIYKPGSKARKSGGRRRGRQGGGSAKK